MKVYRDGIADSLDAGEQRLTAIAISASASGDTTIDTPASGKRYILRKVKVLNDPLASSSVTIQVYLGSQLCISGWVIAERQRFVGDIDAPLIINLSGTGAVRGTAYVEEV